ncbi:THO complex subunit 7 [Clydaea vesicula]|uniref:THO complex subunit 7 n=1 Tax=Clydaea vesicula TaxID=447962 RepID=A0AAD5TVY8_9FUNG|nr:THO complex subunit 7 [Clydaea vesicula]
MNEKEAENYRQEEIRIAKDIKAANNDLATLKLQLNAAQISKQNKQVYDEIAKEIRAYQARDKSEEIISGFQNLISKSEEEKKHLEQAEELRRRKFIAIVNACLDAKDAIDEEIWEREERERLEMKKVEDSDEDDADDDKKDLMDEN